MSEETKLTKRKHDIKTTSNETAVNNEEREEEKTPVEKSSTEKDVKSPKFGPMPSFKHQRVWSRIVVLIGLAIYIWYFATRTKMSNLGFQKDKHDLRGHVVICSSDYEQELSTYPQCFPKHCGRYISDKIVTESETNVLLDLAKEGIALGGSDGGASILDLHSGALSYGTKFINIYSLEESKAIFTKANLAVYKTVKEKVKAAIADLFGISTKVLYLTHPTFFSRLDNREPKTEHDEYWQIHVDKDTYGSFFYTSLLYLTDYGVDFSGGRLIFLDGKPTKPFNVTLEPRKGRVAMFTSGAENVHFVERVKSGIRYAVTISFTCDVSKSIEEASLQED
ncbi:prolyl hydroxylase-related [Holotrichia oblita]|uniref:Prolyl hydroxylase-related n=1 Tax=Holotrichia oblita TaxID=644536 RepID=A0ACB9TZI2_HOLOL|nr:prolyl hydroxylase-related [Holotrichia oblita]